MRSGNLPRNSTPPKLGEIDAGVAESFLALPDKKDLGDGSLFFVTLQLIPYKQYHCFPHTTCLKNVVECESAAKSTLKTIPISEINKTHARVAHCGRRRKTIRMEHYKDKGICARFCADSRGDR